MRDQHALFGRRVSSKVQRRMPVRDGVNISARGQKKVHERRYSVENSDMQAGVVAVLRVDVNARIQSNAHGFYRFGRGCQPRARRVKFRAVAIDTLWINSGIGTKPPAGAERA